jgi:hypothetical protein
MASATPWAFARLEVRQRRKTIPVFVSSVAHIQRCSPLPPFQAVIKSLPADTKVVRFRARDPVPRPSPNVYSFLLCVNAADVHNYQADFMLPVTEWHEVTIAIKALRPNRRGRTVLDAGPLSPAKARGIGLTILRSRQRTPSVSGSGLPFCIELAGGAFEFWG